MRSITQLLLAISLFAQPGLAESQAKKIGLIASLSGFAAEYGVAVREGAELAVDELHRAGIAVELMVEDDQSDPSQSVSAYRQLKDLKGIQALVGGSWWLRPLATITEKDSLPFLSCETMRDGDFVASKSYFILNGRVVDWVGIYEPLFRAKGWKRAAAVKFSSGFSETIAAEMKRLFSSTGREYLGDLSYQQIDFSEAASVVARMRSVKPDVVYLDAQPAGVANFLRRRAEQQLQSIVVVSHSAFEAALNEHLITPQQSQNVYFLRRTPPSPDFSKRFEARFGHAPVLNSDLGYYAVLMAARALQSSEPLETLKKGMVVDGREFSFDGDQVASGVTYQIYRVVDNGEVELQ